MENPCFTVTGQDRFCRPKLK